MIQCFSICSSLPKVETRVGQHLSNEKFNKHIIQHLASEAKGTIVAFLHDKVSSVAMFETDRFYCTYRIYSSISRTFLYLKISPKTGVRLILEASEMTCSNHGTYTYENMRLPYLF